MMKLKLEFEVGQYTSPIDIKDQIILLGSCFSENIGLKLQEYKFQSLVNPFGIIYNPHSILKLISQSINETDEVLTVKSGDVYYDWDAHSQISSLDEKELLQTSQNTRKLLRSWIKDSSWLIITPGTSWIYELKSTGQIVANCHKVPGKSFNRRLLTSDEIRQQFNEVHREIKKVNANIKWLFTVSPVRHVRDGLIENNISKSILIQSIYDITSDYDNCFYFPSYEIVIDELRDYRFYEDDFIHPNKLALDFIWEKFSAAMFSKETNQFVKEWTKIKKSLGHRPFNMTSASHKKFINETISQLEKLRHIVDVNPEIFYLKNQVHEVNS